MPIAPAPGHSREASLATGYVGRLTLDIYKVHVVGWFGSRQAVPAAGLGQRTHAGPQRVLCRRLGRQWRRGPWPGLVVPAWGRRTGGWAGSSRQGGCELEAGVQPCPRPPRGRPRMALLHLPPRADPRDSLSFGLPRLRPALSSPRGSEQPGSEQPPGPGAPRHA